jgi:hypothetical protein
MAPRPQNSQSAEDQRSNQGAASSNQSTASSSTGQSFRKTTGFGKRLGAVLQGPPLGPGIRKEERRLAEQVPFAESWAADAEPWLLAFSIRQPRKTRIICPLSARYVTISWLNNRLNIPTPLKPLPQLITNWEAKRWVDTADLTQYDMSGFQSTSFERTAKD